MTILFPTYGTFFLLFALGFVRKVEKDFLAPAAWFFIIFFFHAYLDPFFRYGADPHLNIYTVPVLIAFTLKANLCLIASYVLFASFYNRKKRNRIVKIQKLFGKTSFYVVVAIAYLVFVILFTGYFYTGRLTQTKAGFSYQLGGAYRQIVTISYILYTLIPAIVLSTYIDVANRVWFKRLIAWSLVLLVAVFSFVQFGRQTIMMVILLIAIIHHNRIKKLTWKNLMFIVVGIILITMFSFLRKLKTGIFSVNFENVYELVKNGEFAFREIMFSLVTAIPGQAVFSNVIEIMQYTGNWWYGKTYIQSLSSILIPNSLLGVSSHVTPAFWYKGVYAPNSLGHGFDFSMFAELYMNFGEWGFLGFFALGLLLAYCSFLVRNASNPVLIIWGALMIVSIVVGLRNDSNALFTRCILFIVPLVVFRFTIIKVLLKESLKSSKVE